MMVSIGILAHNEESDIGNVIRDIGLQKLLRNDNLTLQIHIVANGCVDATVRVAKEALFDDSFRKKNITTFVHNIQQSGKSNAWNQLIHTFVSPNTEFIFLLDADIRIPEDTTLQLLLDGLVRSEIARVAVDSSVKDLSLTASKSLQEWVIVNASGTAHDARKALAGGLYCARFDVLKGIWMPIGLPGEDGFLRAMILTSNFTEDENSDRLIFVEGARHIFESEKNIRDVFHHNIRLAIGTGINVLLFKHFRQCLSKDADVVDYIRKRNAADPNWINEIIASRIGQGRYLLMDKSFIFRRLKWLRTLSVYDQLRKFPIVLLGSIFDLALFFTANYLMRKGVGAGYW